MKIELTKIAGCLLVYPDNHSDNRGNFFELWNKSRIDQEWKQFNCSLSKKNVVRGIHVAPYAKLVTCLTGKIWDVVVDLRENSNTYGEWVGVDLENSQQIYVPNGCGHGFYSYVDDSLVGYLQDSIYTPNVEKRVSWRDEKLKITWPVADYYILSDCDQKA